MDLNQNGTQEPGEDPYVYSEGAEKWDWLVGLRDYIELQLGLNASGSPLIVHDIIDPAEFAEGGCLRNMRKPTPGRTVPRVPTEFRPPTFDDYKRELARSQDVILHIFFFAGVHHAVTGVGYDTTVAPPTITVSDPWTVGGPDHRNNPGHGPYDDCILVALGPPWLVDCPSFGLGQVVNLIFVSPKDP